MFQLFYYYCVFFKELFTFERPWSFKQNGWAVLGMRIIFDKQKVWCFLEKIHCKGSVYCEAVGLLTIHWNLHHWFSSFLWNLKTAWFTLPTMCHMRRCQRIRKTLTRLIQETRSIVQTGRVPQNSSPRPLIYIITEWTLTA